MANKTYFKGKKKSTVKSKKYQFAGFDEATQIDNTGYLNALYNPNYYDTPAVNNEDIKQNVLADVATGQKLAMDKKVMQTTTDANLKRLQGIKNEAEAKNKQQFSEATEQNKDQAIISGSADLLTKGFDIAKQYMKPITPIARTAASGLAPLPSTISTIPLKGVQPGLQLGKQGINLGKGTFTSQMGSVGGSAGKTIGENAAKKGFTSALGSTTWATPGAGVAAGGIGAALSIGGKLWDTLSEDDNPYEYTKKEKWGDWGGNLLSEIGTYGGLGSMFGPLGTGIGAAVGAGIGTFKAIRESKKNKKQAADLNARKAEEDRLYQEQLTNYNNALASQQRFYDYSKNQLRSSILTGEERMRQNRLMGLTEGQLAGNTNIAMTGGGRKYFGKGGVNVPGGQVVPIGQGAVEFVGRSHAQGGIRLDAKTEVEGGETMDKVRMKNGKMNDYFFSKFLKYKGKSFAQHHKELIKRGASQKEIQALAKKQEAMANRKGEKDRSPKQVAEYGGFKKYLTGGVKKYKTAGIKQIPPGNKNYIDSTPWSSAFISYVYGNADTQFPKNPTHTGYATSLKGRKDWQELDPATTKIQPGDIIITNRSGNKQKFGQKSYYGASHGDVVTRIEGDKVYSIGGNVDLDSTKEKDRDKTPDTVAERARSLKNGVLADSGYFVVLRPNNPEVAKKAVQIATKEKELWDKNKWNEYSDTSQERLQTYYQSGKLGIPGVTPDDGKPAAETQLQSNSNDDVYQRIRQNMPPLPSGAVQNVPFFEEALLGLGTGAFRLGKAGLNLLRKGAAEYFGESSSTPSTSTGVRLRPNPQNKPLDYSVGNFTGNIERNPPFSYWEQVVDDIVTFKPNPTEALLRTANATRPVVNRKASEETTTGKSGDAGTKGGSGSRKSSLDYNRLQVPKLGEGINLEQVRNNTAAPQKLALRGTDNLKLPQAPPKLPIMKPALASLKEAPVDKNNLNYYLPILASAGAQTAGTLAAVSKLKNIPAPNFPNYNTPLIQPIPFAPGMQPMGSIPQVNLGRVALDKERTATDNTFVSTSNFIKNNLAGPESMPLLLAAQQKSNDSLLKIADEEQRLNRDIRDKETLVNTDISEKNRRAAMDSYKQYSEGLLTTQQFNTKIAEANQRAMQEKYNYELEKNKALNEFQVAKDMSIAGAWEKLGIGAADTITNAANVYYENQLAKDILKGTGIYNRNFQMGGPKKYFPNRLGDLKHRKLKVKA